jgi:tetratricopeptide (TPR) repeat protein
MLWAVHPLQTESVTYIIQRAESLMGLFLLLTLYCVIRGHDSPRRSWWYATAVICCALGMGSKEGMVIAPVIMLLYDRIFLADSLAEVWDRRSGLYAGLAATWLILISLVIINRVRGGYLPGFTVTSPWHYAQNQFGAIAHYLRLTFWPNRLCLDYGWQASALPKSWILAGAIIIWPLLAATFWALERAPALGFLGAWFFLTLAPSSSVVPIQDMVAERRMYLPLAAVVTLTVIAVWNGLSALSRHFKWIRVAQRSGCFALTILIAGALAWRTAKRNQEYHSAIVIWTNTINQRPQNPRAWNNLGYSYYKAGQFGLAIASYQRAIELLPTYSMAYVNLGDVCLAQGRYQEAVTHLSEALRLNPDDADAHNDLGYALQQLGDREKAMEHFRTAIRLQRNHARAHYNMSVVLADLGRFDEALLELQAVRRLLPNQPEIPYKLGVLLNSHGRYAEACANFAEAVRLKPDFEEARQYLRLCEEKRRAPSPR